MTQNVKNEINVYRGDNFAVELIFTDQDGVAIDITDWTIFFTAKKRRDDPDDAAVLSITAPPTDPVNGKAKVGAPHTETQNLNGAYYYDFQYLRPDGRIHTIVSGTITFQPDITRRTS